MNKIQEKKTSFLSYFMLVKLTLFCRRKLGNAGTNFVSIYVPIKVPGIFAIFLTHCDVII